MIDAEMKNKLAGVVAQVPYLIHPHVVPENLKSRYIAYGEHAGHTVNTKSATLALWGESKCLKW